MGGKSLYLERKEPRTTPFILHKNTNEKLMFSNICVHICFDE